MNLSNSHGLSSSKAHQTFTLSGRTRFADVPANLIDTGVKSFDSLFRGSPEGRQPLLAITSSPRFKGSLTRSLCEPPAWEVSRLSPQGHVVRRLNPYAGHYSPPFAFSEGAPSIAELGEILDDSFK